MLRALGLACLCLSQDHSLRRTHPDLGPRGFVVKELFLASQYVPSQNPGVLCYSVEVGCTPLLFSCGLYSFLSIFECFDTLLGVVMLRDTVLFLSLHSDFLSLYISQNLLFKFCRRHAWGIPSSLRRLPFLGLVNSLNGTPSWSRGYSVDSGTCTWFIGHAWVPVSFHLTFCLPVCSLLGAVRFVAVFATIAFFFWLHTYFAFVWLHCCTCALFVRLIFVLLCLRD